MTALFFHAQVLPVSNPATSCVWEKASDRASAASAASVRVPGARASETLFFRVSTSPSSCQPRYTTFFADGQRYLLSEVTYVVLVIV